VVHDLLIITWQVILAVERQILPPLRCQTDKVLWCRLHVPRLRLITLNIITFSIPRITLHSSHNFIVYLMTELYLLENK